MKLRSRQAAGARALAVLLGLAGVLLVGDRPRRPPGLPAPVPLPGVLGPTKAVPVGFLGFNAEALTGGPNLWPDPRFHSAVATLRPQALRVFGGAPANYWDWRAGTFVRASLLPAHLRAVRSQAHVSLADWAAVVRATRATPIFDLNLLTSSLASQLAMLRAAAGLGMPVTHVELGNELYLPAYASRFPDGAAYGRLATRWIVAIKRRFPAVMVAADAFPGGDANTGRLDLRQRNWNRQLGRTLRGEAALTVHAYFRSGLAEGAMPATAAAAQAMLRAPARRWGAVARLIAGFPVGVDAWVTEWNLFDTRARVHGTWAQGLAVSAFGLDLILAPRVTQADYHALVNNDRFGALFDQGTPPRNPPPGSTRAPQPAQSGFGLYAGGVAMQALLAALAGARSIQGLSFRSARSPPVAGAVFTGPRGERAVIVNPSAQPTSIALPASLRGLPFLEHWAPPGAPVAGVASLHHQLGQTSEALSLEPFSLTRVGE